MLEIQGDHVLALIVGFLKRYGEEKLAQKVQAKIVNTDNLDKAPLTKKKLEKIIKSYVLQDEVLTKFYEKKKQSEEESESEEAPVEKKRKRRQSQQVKPRKVSESKATEEKSKSSIYNKFTKPKLLETTVQKIQVEEEVDESEQEPKKTKTQKKHQKVESKIHKMARKQSSSQESEQQKPKVTKVKKQKKQQSSSSESQEQQKTKKKPEKKVEKQKLSSVLAKPIQPKQTPIYNNDEDQEYPSQKKFFSRIDSSKISPLPANLKDNSFEAKFKFGTGDEWGVYGNQKLKNERGDGFKKMKGKLKNKDFQGGTIDPYKVNSISLL